MKIELRAESKTLRWRRPYRGQGGITALLLLAAVGCPGVPRHLERPRVALQRVAIASVHVRGLEARISLELTNPNPHAVPLEALDWELSIGDSTPMRGRTRLQQRLAGRASATVEVLLQVPPGAADQMARLVANGARDYHLSGTLHFGEIFATFDESGALSP